MSVRFCSLILSSCRRDTQSESAIISWWQLQFKDKWVSKVFSTCIRYFSLFLSCPFVRFPHNECIIQTHSHILPPYSRVLKSWTTINVLSLAVSWEFEPKHLSATVLLSMTCTVCHLHKYYNAYLYHVSHFFQMWILCKFLTCFSLTTCTIPHINGIWITFSHHFQRVFILSVFSFKNI